MTTRALCSAALLVAAAGLGCEQLPNVPPQAFFIFSPVAPIYGGETVVVFNASGSRDSDGSIASYVWNFGDGSAEQTSSSPIVNHVFPNSVNCPPTTYTVLLTIVDDKGDRGSTSGQLNVTKRPDSGACRP